MDDRGVIEGGDQDEGDVRQQLAQVAAELLRWEGARHTGVQKDHVRTLVVSETKGGCRVIGFKDRASLESGCHHHAQAPAGHRMVIDEEYLHAAADSV
ncbi:hypothetical protein GCM10010306_060860 [Streptomyces umbrinus]|nr:hypothetical protein GCM10010306_060860 [Streptomyces umbrinus]